MRRRRRTNSTEVQHHRKSSGRGAPDKTEQTAWLQREQLLKEELRRELAEEVRAAVKEHAAEEANAAKPQESTAELPVNFVALVVARCVTARNPCFALPWALGLLGLAVVEIRFSTSRQN